MTQEQGRPQEQGKLVYDVLDAVSELVRALGGPKTVGSRMRPELPMEQASQWVRDCLNPNRRERFDPAQVMFLLKWGRDSGCHVAMHFITDDAGYTRPSPLDPVDEQARLVRTIQESSLVLKAAIERLDKLSTTPLRAIKSA